MRRVLLMALVLVAGFAVAVQADTIAIQYDVTKSGTQFLLDNQAYRSYKFNLTPTGTDYVRFSNQSGEPIYVTCKESPQGHALKPEVVILNGQTGDVNFLCPADQGRFRFEVGDKAGADIEAELTVYVSCGTPATGTIGIVVLGLLLAGTAAFLMMRRRSLA